jgi:4-hydroxy-tetrahydrodipicolinate reductase
MTAVRTRVAVFGAGGRMGATTCAAVAAAPDLELVAAVDPGAAGRSLADLAAIRGPAGTIVVADAAERLSAGAAGAAGAAGVAGAARVAGSDAAGGGRALGIDVAVDFTVRHAALDNLSWCADHGVHAVCGTTGFSHEDLRTIGEWFHAGGTANAVVAANFSIGAVLMMRCAALCAPHFDAVEVIELHHNRKRDAPSGTSLATVSRMEEARARAGAGPLPDDVTEVETLPGARGARSPGGVPVHSIRLPGLLAHQEVIFGSPGETLRLRHDSIDRVSFMPGVLLAIRRVPELGGLTVGLDSLLGL